MRHRLPRLPRAIAFLCVLVTMTTWLPPDVGQPAFQLLAFTVAGGAVIGVARGRLPWRFSLADALLLLPAAWGVLQLFAGWTVYGFATRGAILRWLALAALCAVIQKCAGNEPGRQVLLSYLSGFAAFLGFWGLLQYFTSEGRWLWMIPSGYDRLIGPFQNRNTFAVFVEIALPVVIWKAATDASRRWLYAVAATLFLTSVILVGARAGTVLVGIELLILCLSYRTLFRTRWALTLVVAAAVLLSLASGWTTLLERFSDRDPWSLRREAVQSSWRMVASRPMTGYGLGTFEHAYPEFAIVDYGTVLKHAHNDWLEFAADGGLPLAALLIGAAIFVSLRCLACVWAIGVPVALLHAAVDFPLHVDGLVVWVLVIACSAVATPAAGLRKIWLKRAAGGPISLL